MSKDTKKLVLFSLMPTLLMGCSGESPGFFPTIELEIPNQITSPGLSINLLALGAAVIDDSQNILERSAALADQSVKFYNWLIEKLNEGSIEEVGTFQGEGPNGEISGRIRGFSFVSDYDYEGVFCTGGAKFMEMRWSKDGANVLVIRDFSVEPVGLGETAAIMGELTYVKGSPSTMDIFMNGKPWEVPLTVTGIENITEYSHWEKDDDEVVTVKAVNEWWQEPPSVFTGDTWLAGQIEKEGTGLYVGYRSFDTSFCTGSFNESDEDEPGWCRGGEIESDDMYTSDEIDSNGSSLSAVGIAQTSELKVVAFGSDLECP